ncbi:MAG TPA: hypothetical protein VEZ71_18375, partial [Archangium sp.]|nr:hypothetical protein [Archangium sp.]
ECESCRRIAADSHPEVMEVQPASKTGQDITVEQVREIRMNASLRPKLGRRRIYVVPNAEAFNETSANALLKTLEEPSDFVTLLLCAPSPSHVLPTIRSRCQSVRFGLAGPAEVAEALTTGGTTPEIAVALARACGGRPGLAISWAQSPSVLKQRRAVLDVFARAVGFQRQARKDPSAGAKSLRLAEELRSLVDTDTEKGEGRARPAKELHSENLEVGLTYLRDLLLLTQGAEPSLAQNQDRITELLDQARYTDRERALADVDSVREAQQLLERNVAPQLVLERMFWALISGALPLRSALLEEAHA